MILATCSVHPAVAVTPAMVAGTGVEKAVEMEAATAAGMGAEKVAGMVVATAGASAEPVTGPSRCSPTGVLTEGGWGLQPPLA